MVAYISIVYMLNLIKFYDISNIVPQKIEKGTMLFAKIDNVCLRLRQTCKHKNIHFYIKILKTFRVINDKV